jgi:hypothetical protein
MIGARLVHRVTDNLPAAAWTIMFAGFREKRTYRRIAIDLASAGFHVAERIVGRRAAEWRAEQVRRGMLQVVGAEAAATDLLEEVVHLIEVIDIGPGWALRARRRVQKAVAAFFDDPSAEQAYAVKLELCRFRLETLGANRRAIDNAEPLAGDQESEKRETAGEAGGGHENGNSGT